MKFGLKSRLNLISLLPLLLIFSLASYYVYHSYTVYQEAQKLQEKVSFNEVLNELLTRLARERGMTSIYMGSIDKTVNSSLKLQRENVDKAIIRYKEYVQTHKLAQKGHAADTCDICMSTRSIQDMLNDLPFIRKKIDNQEIEFDKVFNSYYSAVEFLILDELAKIVHYSHEAEVTSLASTYIGLATAKEYTSAERDFIGFNLARLKKFDEEDLNKWVNLLGKADALTYNQLQTTEAKNALDAIFKTEDVAILFEDITATRTSITQAASDGMYEIDANEWFEMIGEKVRLLNKAEMVLLKFIQDKAAISESDQLQIFITAISVWILSLILTIIGRFLSKELLGNIRNLEALLQRVAASASLETESINLHSAKGTTHAYKLLETVIKQSQDDREAAMHASEAKSMFLANMSHEIRTPLNGIVGFTDLLKDTKLDQEQNEFIDIIQKSSENLLELINNILDLSKIESNKIEIEQVAFNPIEEFESAVEVYSVKAAEKQINLATFIDPSLERPLQGDPTKIKEVIINLLSNAVKFTNNGGDITVEVRRLESMNGFSKVRFQIKDSGIGVTAEQKAKIFEAFGQADTSITRKYGGTGLGLTISKRFIELMGGELDLESEPGQGTMFFFTIDLEEVDTIATSYQQAYKNMQVLILNDQEKNKRQIEFLKEYLTFFGATYQDFTTITELHKYQNESPYALAFIDYDYIDKEMLAKFVDTSIDMALITKSANMKEVDSLGLKLFKVIYEPLTSSKTKTVLEMQANKTKGEVVVEERFFNVNTSRFDADILVAEDNKINQKLIKRTLEDLGLRVTLADNGLEAFEKRKNNDFDLIFMDIQMPILDGMEATQEILEYEEDYEKTHVPIVALTANALKGDRERFLDVGMDEYTTKPLVRNAIISILKQFIGHKIVDSESDDHLTNETQVQTTLQTSVTPIAPLEETVLTESREEIASTPEATQKRRLIVAKKTALENRIASDLAAKLDIEIQTAADKESLEMLIDTFKADLILFDKELKGVNVQAISDTIRHSINENTNIILMHDATIGVTEDETLAVHEVVDSKITKALLLDLIQKYTQG